MPRELTPTQERALEAARGVWRRGGNKAQGAEAGMAVIRKTTPAGYFPQAPSQPRPTMAAAYVPITTPEEAQVLADYLTEYGNYPLGMFPCEVAGINGDAPVGKGCPFLGEDFCNCEED